MKVKLLHNYRGRMSNEQVIPAGIYNSDETSEILLQYWVMNGHAEWVEEPTPTRATVVDGEPLNRPKRKSFGD